MKKTAYIDNNILIDFEDNEIGRFDLIENVDNRIVDLYYSAAHLQEAHEMKESDPSSFHSRLERRCKSISRLTKNKYFYHELPSNQVHKMILEPKEVYETITAVSFGQSMMKAMMNMIDEEQKKSFREQLNINPLRINNYSPKEVIEHINTKLGLFGDMSIVKMVEQSIDFHPQGKTFGLHNRIAGLFEFIDMIGYWKDKYTQKSNYARLWDSNHCYFGIFCDYFISNDRRTRNKAKVAYEIYNIATKVTSSTGSE
ncbi:hypothetical protein GTQ34_05665 [Muricauda sp. JGD-17]|uniref:Uncharacterized protein n=1 Tax=Flagellimonas ochracea TaxID=2696472 RepID=A0A964TC09_9FLAO|nr:hypothetical protein [Allomuricauda ochracea]NAY91401.1 hypothetical protein [Allomuricauda ochracea]